MPKKIMLGGSPPPVSEFDRLLENQIQKQFGTSHSAQSQFAQAKQRLLARRSTLFPMQLAFIESPVKKKAAVCTRRAGKTFACRHLAAEAVVNNGWTDRQKAQPVVQYITTTRAKALDLFWTPFKELCREIGLDAHWDDHSLRAQFPNGVLVRAGGCDDREAIESYRGDAYVLVIVDEAASLGARAEELVVAGISMALADYDGTIAMIGTPGQVQAGIFYKIYCGEQPGWEKPFKWSYMTNTSFPESVRTDDWVRENIGPLDSPKVLREAYGEWVPDNSTLVYSGYEAAKTQWDGKLPAGHQWRYILGLDLGYNDPTAFVVVAYARTHQSLYVVFSESTPHLLPTQIAERVVALQARFQGLSRIVVDTGGSMARSNMEEWNRRYNFGMIAAEKTKKLDFIEHLNSEFYRGLIKIHPNSTKLRNQLATLPWAELDPEQVRHDTKQSLKEHAGFENHETDAFLYAFRESLHYRSKVPTADEPYGTEEWHRLQQLHAKRQALITAGKPAKFSYSKLIQIKR